MYHRHIARLPAALFFGVVAVAFLFTGCDTMTNNQQEQPFDGTGTVSGQLVDKVTNEPLSGAVVTLKSARGENDSSSRTDTTGSDGAFYFEDVPVNRASDSGTPSSQHVLDLDLSGVSGSYRSRYTAEVSLPYGGSEEGGSANNLTAGVTIPVSPLNAEINGRINDVDGNPLSGANVVLVQRLPLRFDAAGSPSDFTDVQVDTATTGEDGSYTFSGAEASSSAYLLVSANGQTIGRDPGSGYFTVPASGSGAATVDRGASAVTPPSFRATLVSPERGTDLDQDSVEFTFQFNAPVAEAPFTSTDAPFGNGTMRDVLNVKRVGPKRRVSGDLELELSFNDDRTELTVSTVDSLRDGSEYEFDASAFGDDRFESAYGQSVANAGDFSGGAAIAFSVGIDESAPSAPTLEFATDDGTQPTEGGTPYDYGDDFSAQFRVPAPSSGPELKGYEVFVKSGDGDFKPIDTATFDAFEFDGSGRVEFQASFRDPGDDPLNNFVGSNGGYNEKQLKVRAISINNVRGEFSNTLTIADQNRLDVRSASIEDADDDGEDELVAEFNEPVATGSISAGVFTVLRDGSELSGVIQGAERPPFTGEKVVLEISDSYTPNDGFSNDELRADTGGVTDLAGNGIDDDGGANVVNIP
ncbi:MAG: hypothetical protein ABEL97_10005 [Salinibacter sp.]